MQVKIKYPDGKEKSLNISKKDFKAAMKIMAKKSLEKGEEKKEHSATLDFDMNLAKFISPVEEEWIYVDDVYFDLSNKNIFWSIQSFKKDIPMPNVCINQLQYGEKENLQIAMIEAFDNFVKPTVENSLSEINQLLIREESDHSSLAQELAKKHQKKLAFIEKQYEVEIANIEQQLLDIPDENSLKTIIMPYTGQELIEIEEKAENLELELEQYEDDLATLEKKLEKDQENTFQSKKTLFRFLSSQKANNTEENALVKTKVKIQELIDMDKQNIFQIQTELHRLQEVLTANDKLVEKYRLLREKRRRERQKEDRKKEEEKKLLCRLLQIFKKIKGPMIA